MNGFHQYFGAIDDFGAKYKVEWVVGHSKFRWIGKYK
jgi:hypothetical protein